MVLAGIAGIAGSGASLVGATTANSSRDRRTLERQLGLRGRKALTPARQLRHPVLKTEELHRRAQTVTWSAREQEQLLANGAREVRGGSLTQQRRDLHRVAAHQGRLDLSQITEEPLELVAPAAPGGFLVSHG